MKKRLATLGIVFLLALNLLPAFAAQGSYYDSFYFWAFIDSTSGIGTNRMHHFETHHSQRYSNATARVTVNGQSFFQTASPGQVARVYASSFFEAHSHALEQFLSRGKMIFAIKIFSVMLKTIKYRP